MGNQRVQGLILAGGVSTRMGTDKALLPIAGKPLIYRLVEQLSRLTEHVTVSVGSPEREALYRESLGEWGEAVSFVIDDFPECGPLSGLHAGLSSIGDGYVFTMACDMPELSEELLSVLLAHTDSEADVIYAPGQPFHALYHARAAAQIEEALKAGDYRLMGLFNRLRTVVINSQEQGESSVFINLNTPAEYNKYVAENE